MDKRIIGIETEFGCLVSDDTVGTAEMVVEQVKDHAFYKDKVGLIDLHARDYAFEPARCGGFLRSGGRLYIDAVGSHMEYATPECTDFADAVAYDKAGRVILQRLLRELDLQDKVSFHSNSVDHFGGHTFGCHENYLVAIDDRFFLEALSYLLPFLVTRQIFAGVGRVGGHRLNYKSLKNNIMTISDYEVDYQWVGNFYGVEVDPTIDFQLSQRADHIVKTISSRVRFNRAIINPKWDSYYNYSNLHRLHILFGECNMSEYATLMKVGTTSLVLDLIEDGILLPRRRTARPAGRPQVRLARPDLEVAGAPQGRRQHQGRGLAAPLPRRRPGALRRARRPDRLRAGRVGESAWTRWKRTRTCWPTGWTGSPSARCWKTSWRTRATSSGATTSCTRWTWSTTTSTPRRACTTAWSRPA